jgi:hypothetical protein
MLQRSVWLRKPYHKFVQGLVSAGCGNDGALVLMLEMLFPNSDQRNMWDSFSKAKRKVLLLQKGAATDYSLIGRTH